MHKVRPGRRRMVLSAAREHRRRPGPNLLDDRAIARRRGQNVWPNRSRRPVARILRPVFRGGQADRSPLDPADEPAWWSSHGFASFARRSTRWRSSGSTWIARGTVHGEEPRSATARSAAGQPPGEAGASQIFTIPLRRSGPVENVAFSASSEGLPEVGRSIFVYHDDLAPEWLELALAGGKLQIAPDGSAGRILHADQPVAVLAPLVHCEGRAARLAAAMTPEGIAVRGEGIDLAIAVSGSEIHFSIRGAQPCEGPVVRVLGGLEAGLLAGLEHLGRGEAGRPGWMWRPRRPPFRADPLLLTMPLMSIVTDRAPSRSPGTTCGPAGLRRRTSSTRRAITMAAPRYEDRGRGPGRPRAARRGDRLVGQAAWAALAAGGRERRAQERCLKGSTGPENRGRLGHCVEDRWPRRYFADMARRCFA